MLFVSGLRLPHLRGGAPSGLPVGSWYDAVVGSFLRLSDSDRPVARLVYIFPLFLHHGAPPTSGMSASVFRWPLAVFLLLEGIGMCGL